MKLIPSIGLLPLFCHGLVDQSQCGNEIQCHQLPENCDYSSSSDACTLISWDAEGDGVNFAITHKAADANSYWAAFVLAKSPTQMADGDSYFCYLDTSQTNPTPQLEARYFVGTTRPTLYTATELTDISYEAENNVFECKFTRPHSMADVSGFSLSDYNTETSLFTVLVAAGTYDAGNNGPQYHGQTRSDPSKQSGVNFTAEEQTQAAPTGKPFSVIGTEVHGVFMILAWSIFAGISLFTARNGKAVFNSEKVLQKQSWFLIHVGMNSFILIFTLIATLVIFAARDWAWVGSMRPAGSDNRTHVCLGITVVALLGANFILGLIRPDKSGKLRPLWEICHSLFGNAAHIIGISAIVIGLNLFRGFSGLDGTNPPAISWPAILVIVAVCFEALFDLICGVIRYKKIESKLPEYLWYVNTTLTAIMGIAAIIGIFV